jgi:hypothetical protein
MTKVLIAGTPLESLGWQRDLEKVRVRFRDVPVEDKLAFVTDVITTFGKLQYELIDEYIKTHLTEARNAELQQD